MIIEELDEIIASSHNGGFKAETLMRCKATIDGLESKAAWLEEELSEKTKAIEFEQAEVARLKVLVESRNTEIGIEQLKRLGVERERDALLAQLATARKHVSRLLLVYYVGLDEAQQQIESAYKFLTQEPTP